MSLDTSAIRQEFPMFQGDSPPIYFDTAATAQKPQAVLDAMDDFYVNNNANVHRGVHSMTETATVMYEDARKTVQEFIGAASTEEIIFTKGATEAINLVARAGGEKFLQKGDTVALSYLEHHSNIVPWFQLKEKLGINIEWIDLDEHGQIDMNSLDEILNNHTVKLVAITAQSNVTGIKTPIKEVVSKAHDAGAIVLVDAAQAVVHGPMNVQDLDCDFLVFSGHKLYGPTGIGVLYGKKELLEKTPPFLGGGGMIVEVTTDGFTPADLPAKLEAGTPPIAEAIGLQAAIKWLTQFNWNDIEQHEQSVLKYSLEQLSTIEDLELLHKLKAKSYNLKARSGCFSFILNSIHSHDLTDILGQHKISLRAGHHCTMPLHKKLGVSASTRLSVGIYNIKEEADALTEAVKEARSVIA